VSGVRTGYQVEKYTLIKGRGALFLSLHNLLQVPGKRREKNKTDRRMRDRRGSVALK